jgi:hypothetical protein
MQYQIRIWFRKDWISFSKAMYELKMLGFTEFAAEQYLYERD